MGVTVSLAAVAISYSVLCTRTRWGTITGPPTARVRVSWQLGTNWNTGSAHCWYENAIDAYNSI